MKNNTHQRFELGKIIISSQTHKLAHPKDLVRALLRHARGDWGEVDATVWQHNQGALTDRPGDSIASMHRDRYQRDIYVVTNPKCSETTVTLCSGRP